MTRNILKLLTVTLLVGGLTPLGFAAPAHAGGRISFDLAPGNAADGDLLSTGLRAYSLYRGLKDSDIRQLGRGNAAGIAQNGGGNLGFIRQRGTGHSRNAAAEWQQQCLWHLPIRPQHGYQCGAGRG